MLRSLVAGLLLMANPAPAAEDAGALWLLQAAGRPVGRVTVAVTHEPQRTAGTYSERTEVRRDLPGRYQLNVDTLHWALDASHAGVWSRLAGERRSSAHWTVLPLGAGLWFRGEAAPPAVLDIPPDWLPDPDIGATIARWLAQGAPGTLRYSRLLPESGRFQSLALQADPQRVAGGGSLPLQMQIGGLQPVSVEFDPVRRLLVQPLWRHGQWLTPVACAAPCATHLEPYDPVLALQVAAPYRMSDAARAGRVRYLLQQDGGPAATLPRTDEQSVVQQAHRTVLTICQDCGDESAPDATTLIQLRRPNRWVQSDHPAILTLLQSAPAANAEQSPAERLQQLASLVRGHVDGRTDVEGYADASTVARLRGGDCTEYAVLLAALARADGWPTRIVAGMVYSESDPDRPARFVPHLWVQAWDAGAERWRSADAAAGPFGAGHIALAIGDGTPQAFGDVLGLMQALEVKAAAQLPATGPGS